MEKNTKSETTKSRISTHKGKFRRSNEKPEFDHRVVDVRRVARVMAGGRRFSFSVVCILGDRRGRVGVGIGKARDTALAIEKAQNNAKKNMIKVLLNENKSIPFQTEAKYGASEIIIKPSPGRGLVAGGSVRVLLDLAGIKDVNAKIISRSKNKLNNARATIEALKKLSNSQK
ncbi:MAG TPA: 30S ribosomal protein S5 [Candidatus Vogelbacteria bacterium]|mgnify:CR=1 FL=1|nr:30S ribosomal protein S5 [Candidatus Vogelbacteria bacterium]